MGKVNRGQAARSAQDSRQTAEGAPREEGLLPAQEAHSLQEARWRRGRFSWTWRSRCTMHMRTCGVEGGDTQGGEGAGAKVPRRWVYSKQVQHDSPTCSTNNVCRSLKVHEERVTEGVLNAKPQGIQPQSNGEAWKGPEQVIRNICISHTRAGKWLEKLTAGGEDRSG